MRAMLVAALFVGGCATRMPSTKMVAVETTGSGVCAADADCTSHQLCIDRACHDIAGATIGACTELPIHFATNSAAIDRRNRSELNQTALCLRNDRGVHVLIAGNADERGTSDYNRALAQRRADAVARYLESAGVSAAQLSTASYGADDPMCTAHDRECWKMNRRVEIAPSKLRASFAPAEKNKLSTDEDIEGSQHLDSTGHGEDNGSPLGK